MAYGIETAAEFVVPSPLGLGLSDASTSIHPLASSPESNSWLTGDSQIAEDYAAFKDRYGRGAQVVEGAAVMKLAPGRVAKTAGLVMIIGAMLYGKPEINGVQGEEGNNGPDKGDRDPLPSEKTKHKQSTLLPREGDVGTYDELRKAGAVGDDITPHHMPADDYMQAAGPEGYTRGQGIAMNMEQPPVGGRHRGTASYGRSSDSTVAPRDALARSIRDARRVYQEAGEYTAHIREGLQAVAEQNMTKWKDFFKKAEQAGKKIK